MSPNPENAVGLEGPKPLEDLRLVRFAGREALSTLFEYQLLLYGRGSEDGVDPDHVLGESVTVSIYGYRGAARYFNGIVTEFEHLGFSERYQERFHEYRAVLRPALWLLTQRSNCQVFQKLSTPAIFGKMCDGARVTHRAKLNRTYPSWEYRVQYRESDFDFVSRLLEHEGLFYYFEHSDGKHELVLADDVGMLESAHGYEEVPYFPPGANVTTQRKRDHLDVWTFRKSFLAASSASADYNFEKPSLRLEDSTDVPHRRDASQFQLFEYPATPPELTPSNVRQLTTVRAQQLNGAQTRAHAQGDATGLATGKVFKLTDHPQRSNNKKYLVAATTCELTAERGEEWGRGAADPISNVRISIEALDAHAPYRPERVTPKPVIQGTQTALVVGPAGKEIWTDKYGRVRLKFHWDRSETQDEDRTCWVRVAQGWAGKGWGVQYVPRIGHEVVVSFLDGDPDRPLVIASVYNAEQMPPYALPDKATQSGVKTRSSPGGAADDFNELRFEDDKGKEEIHLQAQKDLTLLVKNDCKVEVKNDLDVTVTAKESRTVTKDRTTTAQENDTLTVNKQFKLTANDSITLQCGAAKIVLKSDGSVEISGNALKFSGTQKAALDAAQTTVSGTQVSVSGTKTAVAGSGMLDLSSSGVASLKGTLTKIG